MPPRSGSTIPELPKSPRDPDPHRSDPNARRSSFKVEDLTGQRRSSSKGERASSKRTPRRKSTGDEGKPFQLTDGAEIASKVGSSSNWEVEKVAQELSLRCHDHEPSASVSSPPGGALPPLKLRHRHSVEFEDEHSKRRNSGGVGNVHGGRLHTDMATAFPECPGAACASSVYNRRKEKKEKHLASMASPSGTTQSTEDRREDDLSDDGLSDSDPDSDAGAGDAEGLPQASQSAHELRLAPKPPDEPRKPRRPSTTGMLQPPRTRRHSTGSPNPTALLDGVRRELGSRNRNSIAVPEVGPRTSAAPSPRPLPPEGSPKSPRRPSKQSADRRPSKQSAADRVPVHLRQRPSFRECQNFGRGGEQPSGQGGGGGAVGSDARPHQDDLSRREISGNGLDVPGGRTSRIASPGATTNSTGFIASTERAGLNSGSSNRGTATFRDTASRQSTFRDETAIVARKSAVNAKAWSAAFRTLKIDSEVARDSLSKALDIAGFLDPNKTWIEEIVGEITNGDALECEEFYHFLRAYTARECRERREAFAELCDGDLSGTLDPEEVSVLLGKLGVDVMFHVLSEVFREVDEGFGRIDFDEFDEFMDILARRQFFTKNEYEDFRKIYARHDRDNTGAVSKEDLPGILGWLGYSSQDDLAAEAMAEVATSTFTEQEFIACMRKVHQCEIKLIRETFLPDPETGESTIPASKLDEVLRALGHAAPDHDAIHEVALDLDIKEESERLDVSDIWQFLIIFRTREGLNGAETTELKEAFQRYDKACQGEISSLEVGKLLRWLGYQLPYEVLQHFVNRVDVDESGALDFSELRKLIRMHRERDLDLMEEAFLAQEPDDNETISVKKAQAALGGLGYLDGKCSMLAAGAEAKDGRMDVRSFLRVAVRASKASRRAFRKNGGFTSAQVDQLQLMFKEYDQTNSGSLCNKEIVLLIEDVLPDMAHDSDMRPELVKLMKDADTDGNGSLEFPDFLRLMRQFHDVQDRERVKKEQDAIKETGFNQNEVAGFRELFISACGDDGSGDLTFKAICNLIDGVTPLGDKYLHQLSKMFDEVTHGQRMKARPRTGPIGLLKSSREKAGEAGAKEPSESKAQKAPTADFPEFLWLLKKLMDSDFAGIRQRTQGGRASPA